MKIKTQFNLLIVGIILVPLLSIAAQALIWRMQQRESPLVVPLYEELAPMLQKSIDNREWKTIRNFVRRLRPNTEIALFRSDMTVLYSSIDNFIAGDRVTKDSIYSLINAENIHYGYSFESPPWLQEGRIFLLLRNAREIPRLQNPSFFIIRSLFTVNIILFTFVLVMSIIIARSITRSVLVLEDATRRIAAGELDLMLEPGKTEFLRQDNEITSLTYSLNRMRLTLKEEEQSRSRFIMGVTHDLKTPLSLIKGYTEAIKDGVTSGPEAQGKSLEIITDKVDQLESMINDLINFVRLDTGEWRQKLQPVEFHTFLNAFSRRFKDDAELLKRNPECRIDVGEGIMVPMDEALVSRALENLVNNGLRYTKEGDTVRLTAFVRETGQLGGKRSVIIRVEDSGPGIAPEDLPHIFEMFYRGDNSRRQQGIGLGLSVVKGVIDSHGWEIAVESPLFSAPANPGARFTITVPC